MNTKEKLTWANKMIKTHNLQNPQPITEGKTSIDLSKKTSGWRSFMDGISWNYKF